MKYHISPKTGNPGSCSAKEGNCPFGSDAPHFSTAEDARKAFELAQGGSFGIKAPLLATNKKQITNLINDKLPRKWKSGWNEIADTSGVMEATIEELRNVANIGFSNKAAREESSQRLNQLANDLYDKRTSKDLDAALTARMAYHHIIKEFADSNMKDLRSMEEQETDEGVVFGYRYQADYMGNLNDKELAALKIAAEKPVLELTDNEVKALSEQSLGGGWAGSKFSSDTVKYAKTIEKIKTVVAKFDKLDPDVQEMLGGKQGVADKLAAAEKLAENGLSRKEQVGDLAGLEQERRKKNSEILDLLKKEAK